MTHVIIYEAVTSLVELLFNKYHFRKIKINQSMINERMFLIINLQLKEMEISSFFKRIKLNHHVQILLIQKAKLAQYMFCFFINM